MPSFANSSPIAPNKVSAFLSFTRANIIKIRKSGRRSNKFFGEICPIITASFAPCRTKNLIKRLSCPTRIHSISSSLPPKSEAVSPSKAIPTKRVSGA